MMLFTQNETSSTTVILASGGTAVTGLVASDILCYVSKNGGSPVVYDLTARVTELDSSVMPGLYSIELNGAESLDVQGEVVFRFSEDPGALSSFDSYLVKGLVYTNNLSGLDATTLSTKGTVEATESTLGAVEINVLGIGSDLEAVKGEPGYDAATDSLKAQRDIFDTRVPSEAAKVSDLENAGLAQAAPVGVGLWDVLGDGTVTLEDLSVSLRRILGLVHENFVITGQNYDASNNLLGASVKIYDSSSDAEADINAIATYSIEATYDSGGRLIDYKMLRENA